MANNFLQKKVKDADISVRLMKYLHLAFEKGASQSSIVLKNIWEKRNVYQFLCENCTQFNSQCWAELSVYFAQNGYQLKK